MNEHNTVLARSMRPKSLDDMVGAEKIIKRIRTRIKSGRIPRVWLFCGQTGSGKTTMGRIVARAVQCKHHKKFGEFCSRCWKHRHEFDNVEQNAADFTGVDAMRDLLEFSNRYPMPGSRRRVYLFDEVHQHSKSTQNLLLKYTEECPETTVFILCTTDEEAVIRTLRRRCKIYVMPNLDLDGIRHLVKRALKKIHCDYDSQELIEKLMEKDVTSPGLILNAVESYSEGATAEEASEVEATSEIVIKGLNRQLIKGDWESVAAQLRHMTPEDVKRVQGAVSKYLLGILLGETEFSGRNETLTRAILRISDLSGTDNVQMSAMGAILYKVCKLFKEYPR